eukprot:3152759-Pleurochrysis_carterae.AAC.2
MLTTPIVGLPISKVAAFAVTKDSCFTRPCRTRTTAQMTYSLLESLTAYSLYTGRSLGRYSSRVLYTIAPRHLSGNTDRLMLPYCAFEHAVTKGFEHNYKCNSAATRDTPHFLIEKDEIIRFDRSESRSCAIGSRCLARRIRASSSCRLEFGGCTRPCPRGGQPHSEHAPRAPVPQQTRALSQSLGARSLRAASAPPVSKRGVHRVSVEVRPS